MSEPGGCPRRALTGLFVLKPYAPSSSRPHLAVTHRGREAAARACPVWPERARALRLTVAPMRRASSLARNIGDAARLSVARAHTVCLSLRHRARKSARRSMMLNQCRERNRARSTRIGKACACSCPLSNRGVDVPKAARPKAHRRWRGTLLRFLAVAGKRVNWGRLRRSVSYADVRMASTTAWPARQCCLLMTYESPCGVRRCRRRSAGSRCFCR